MKVLSFFTRFEWKSTPRNSERTMFSSERKERRESSAIILDCFARRDIRSIINTTKRTKKAQRSTRHYAAERSLPVEFSPRNIRSLWRRRRGARAQRELETWLKILRCGRKWISDTRNATLFGTITRESPSKLPISPSAPAGNIFTRSEGTYLRLGVPAHTRAHPRTPGNM